MTLTPQPSDKFTFGLWTVGNPGRDPFGEPTRKPLKPTYSVQKLAELGAYGVSLHDNDLVPFDATSQERDRIVAEFKQSLNDTGLKVTMATTNLFTDPVFKDGAFTAADARVRAFALQKTMKAMDLGAELGAPVYVFWGGREGAEVDAGCNTMDALEHFREALNFLAEYSDAQGYGFRFALEPKPNEPRGDIYLPTVGSALGFITTLDKSEHFGVNPEFAHETMAGLSFSARGCPSPRRGQTLSRRLKRPETGPFRPGFALWGGEPQRRVFYGEAFGGVGVWRRAALRRARAPYRRRSRGVGVCRGVYEDVLAAQRKGQAV